MSLGTVDSSNIVSQVWQNVYDIVKYNVSDPKGRDKWVYSAFPAARDATVDTFPCIVIDGSQITSEHFVIGSNKRYVWTIPIYVYDTTMATCDSVSDSVVEQLEANKGSLTTYGFFQSLISVSQPSHIIVSNNIIHERRIDLRVEGVV